MDQGLANAAMGYLDIDPGIKNGLAVLAKKRQKPIAPTPTDTPLSPPSGLNSIASPDAGMNV